jgi:hypothetical protein
MSLLGTGSHKPHFNAPGLAKELSRMRSHRLNSLICYARYAQTRNSLAREGIQTQIIVTAARYVVMRVSFKRTLDSSRELNISEADELWCDAESMLRDEW